jgi:Ca2+-binding RTX toxin-like protein
VAATSGHIDVHVENVEGPFAGSGDGESDFSALVQYSIEPPEGPCPTDGCKLFLTTLQADVDDFTVVIDLIDPATTRDVPVTNMEVVNFGWVRGTWREDGTFVIPEGAMRALVVATVDGDGMLSVSSNSGEITGTLNRETGDISFDTFTISSSDGRTVVSSEPAQVIQSRPSAAIAPASPVECNAFRSAEVNLDATGSFDPDGDLEAFRWLVNGEGPSFGAMVPATLNFDTLNDIYLRASDSRLGFDEATASIQVLDTIPPQLVTPAVNIIDVCAPKPQAIDVPLPVVEEVCTPDTITLIGYVVAVNGKPIDPIRVIDGQAVLPLGTHTVHWDVIDESGNPNELDDMFTVQQTSSQTCCEAGQKLIEGSDGRDVIIPREEIGYCVLALSSHDVVQLRGFADFISGGDGDDRLRSGGGVDLVVADDGMDVITGGRGGQLEAHGGAGDDVLDARLTQMCELYGSFGDDLLLGGDGDDVLFPGPGADTVLAAAGNDRIVILNICEIEAGMILNGGAGFDTLVTPVPLAELERLGVVVLQFENVVVDDSQQHLSDCF